MTDQIQHLKSRVDGVSPGLAPVSILEHSQTPVAADGNTPALHDQATGMNRGNRLNLDSLAAVKRACQPGALIEIVATDAPHLQRTMLEGRRRPIVKAQSNAIVIQGNHSNGGETYDPDMHGWLYWPKADEIQCHGDDTFTYKALATYRVIPGPPEPNR